MKISKYGVEIGFAVIILLTVIFATYKRNKLLENYSVGTCTVIGCSPSGKGHGGSCYIDFAYEYDGNVYHKHELYGDIKINDCNSYLAGRQVPFIFYKGEPSLAKLLIAPSDFKRVHLKFPDSLRDLANGLGLD